MQRLQRDQRVAAGQVLPEVHLANAEDPGERRPDPLPLDGRTDLAHPRFHLSMIGRGAVELGARDDAFVEQTLHPLEVERGEVALRFGRRQLRLLLARVEDGEHRTFANRLPGVKGDAVDRAREIGTDRHALNRRHGADGAERGRPLLLLRHDGRHCFGWGVKRRSLGDGRLDLLELHEAQRRNNQQRHTEHHNHSLQHWCSIHIVRVVRSVQRVRIVLTFEPFRSFDVRIVRNGSNDWNGSHDANDPNASNGSYCCPRPLLRTIGQVRDPLLTLARESRAERPAEADLILLEEVAIAHEGIPPVVSIAPGSAG
jgi:hypothetical protein